MGRARAKKKGALLELPPLPHAAAHERLLARLAKMSAEEIFQTMIDAGIYTRDRKLTKAYRTPREAPARAR